jgi:dihydroorotate dehydrogenase (NAD+) catalytic subunit
MINLASGHKQGLLLAHPLVLAAGVVSYGETLPPGVDLGRVGAVVVGPVLAQSSAGELGKRMAEVAGGVVLGTGRQNRGVRAVVSKFARRWEEMPCAVVVQVADTDVYALTESVGVLTDAGGFDGLEVLIGDGVSLKAARVLVQRAVALADVPVWVKVPMARAVRLAEVALDLGAAAVVVGEPLRGVMAFHPTRQPDGVADVQPDMQPDARDGALLVDGRVYGPALFPVMLRAMIEVRSRFPDCALIAAGGIHSVEMARSALAAGADAVALDSVVWVDPDSVNVIGAALE